MTKVQKTIINDYNADDIDVILDDIERIRVRTNMYIGYRGWKAVVHLLKEIIQNSIDEAASGGLCNLIEVIFDEQTRTLTVSDNGRGVPQEKDKLFLIATVIQSSGKFNKGDGKSYKKAAGENGVGLTCTNALSVKCTVNSCRNGNSKTIYFERGKRVNEVDEEVSNAKHGTTVSFTPDETILGKIKMNRDDVFNLCKTMSFLSRVRIKCTCITNAGKVIVNDYKSENGILDLVKELADKPVIKPIYFYKEVETMSAEVAFVYDPENPILTKDNNVGNEFIVSFANFCTTVTGGTHVKGLREGIGQALTKYTKDNCLNKKELTTLTVNAEDARNGLIAVVNITIDNASFVGQVKETINNPELAPFVKSVVVNGFKEWMKTNSSDAKKLGDYVKSMAKIRTNAAKEKKLIVKDNFSNGFSGNRPKNWSGKCSLYGKINPETGKKYETELEMVEGDSANGSTKQARDKRFQETYKFRGVPLNTIPRVYSKEAVKKAFDNAMDNEEFRGLHTVIMNNPHDRYIIMTDADIDGNRITSLISGYFLFHQTQAVKEGKLYKALPPLYRIRKKGKDIYFNDNLEYIEYVQDEISKKLSIEARDKATGKWVVMTKSDIVTMMLEGADYIRKLEKLSKTCSPELLEFFITKISLIRDGRIKEYEEYIKTRSKNLKVVSKSDDLKFITGLCDKEIQMIRVNKKFISKTIILQNYIDHVQWNKFRVNDKELSLIQILKLLDSYKPANRQRFKGLGEMNAIELGETTLKPGKRKLIRLTTEDLEREINQFLVLHSEAPKYKAERKELMSKFKISIDDIDN